MIPPNTECTVECNNENVLFLLVSELLNDHQECNQESGKCDSAVPQVRYIFA